ncbi:MULTISPECIES: hypothetical protein, partial [unclassified Campylobacter]|uniref:hypothetical protein n=1 Tax=unclassified Campylobacter TaxID=2593542 RepID=UPI0022E9D26B
MNKVFKLKKGANGLKVVSEIAKSHTGERVGLHAGLLSRLGGAVKGYGLYGLVAALFAVSIPTDAFAVAESGGTWDNDAKLGRGVNVHGASSDAFGNSAWGYKTTAGRDAVETVIHHSPTYEERAQELIDAFNALNSGATDIDISYLYTSGGKIYATRYDEYNLNYDENDVGVYIDKSKLTGLNLKDDAGRTCGGGNNLFLHFDGRIECGGFGINENKFLSGAQGSDTYEWDETVTVSKATVNATATGYKTKATGNESFAIGMNTQATGDRSFTYGMIDSSKEGGTEAGAHGRNSMAGGYNTRATGENAVALGSTTVASGGGSVAMGYKTLAAGELSVAWGEGSKVVAQMSDGTEVEILLATDNKNPFNLPINTYYIVDVNGNKIDDNDSNGYVNRNEAEKYVQRHSDGYLPAKASTAFGMNSTVYASNALGALGGTVNMKGANSAAIGVDSNVSSGHSFALGNGAYIGEDSNGSIALGGSSENPSIIGNKSSNSFAAIGGVVGDNAQNSISMGGVVDEKASKAVAIGDDSYARMTKNIAIGTDAKAGHKLTEMYIQATFINDNNPTKIMVKAYTRAELEAMGITGATKTYYYAYYKKGNQEIKVGGLDRDKDLYENKDINGELKTELLRAYAFNSSESYANFNQSWVAKDDKTTAADVAENVATFIWNNRDPKKGFFTDRVEMAAKDGVQIAIGPNSYAMYKGAVALGNSATAGGAYTIAIGENAMATTFVEQSGGNIAIGGNAKAVEMNSKDPNDRPGQSTAVGYSALATGGQAMALGANTVASGYGSISIGGDDIGGAASAFKLEELDKYLEILGGEEQGSDHIKILRGIFSGELLSSRVENGITIRELTVNEKKINDLPNLTKEEKDDLIAELKDKYKKYVAVPTPADGNLYIPTTASALGSMAVGQSSESNNTFSNTFGYANKSGGIASSAIGTYNIVVGHGSTAMGLENFIKDTNSTAIGVINRIDEDSNNSMALGNGNTITHSINSISAGYYNENNGSRTISVGLYNDANNTDAAAVGRGNWALGIGSIAVGGENNATGAYSTAFGLRNQADENNTLAIGMLNNAKAVNSMALGADNNTTAAFSVAAGMSNKAEGNYSAALGFGNVASGFQSFSVGKDNTVTIDGNESIAHGYRNRVSGANSIAMGSDNTISGNNSGAFGDPSAVTANRSYSFGNDNRIGKTAGDANLTDNTSKHIYVVGNDNIVGQNGNAENIFVLGGNVTETINDSVFLGDGAAYVTGNTTGAMDEIKTATIGGFTYGDFAGYKPIGVVSVGNATDPRRIQNVAAGLIDKNSTDAINGSQLYWIAKGLDGNKTKVTVNGGTEAPKTPGQYTDGNLKLTHGGEDNNTYDLKLANNLTIGEKGENGKPGEDGQIKVIDKDGNPGVTVAAKDGNGTIGLNGKNGNDAVKADITLEKGEPGVKETNEKTRIVYTTEDGKKETIATLNDGLKFGGNYLEGTDKNISKKLGETLEVVGSHKAGKDQLTTGNIGVINDGEKLVIELAKAVDLTKDGNLTIGNTFVNNNGLTINNTDPDKIIKLTDNNVSMGGNQIHNVEAGEADTDAVNVSQLKEAAEGNRTYLTVNGGTEAPKTPGQYTDGNLKLTHGGEDNNTYDLKLANNLTIGEKGENGKPGEDGKIEVIDKDGNPGVTVAAKDGNGTIGLNGKNGNDAVKADITLEKGEPGVKETNEKTRIVYTT